MQTKWKKLVPFKGRNSSGPSDQNFLYSADKVYVMDNHRAAMWCWLQEIDYEKPHSIIHIDRHYDTRNDEIAQAKRHLPAWNADINTHLAKDYKPHGSRIKVVRWDTYFSIYLDNWGRNVNLIHSLTHGDGEIFRHNQVYEHSSWELPELFNHWLCEEQGPWIVNIDLDYFFCNGVDHERPVRMLSDDYVSKLGAELKDAMERGVVGVVTLCFTPDVPLTTGWKDCEALASLFLGELGMTLEL